MRESTVGADMTNVIAFLRDGHVLLKVRRFTGRKERVLARE